MQDILSVLKDKKIFGILSLIILLFIVIITLRVLTTPQENRSGAHQATTLKFYPASTAFVPIRKRIGEKFSIDIMVDPGQNSVSFVKFEVLYPQNVLTIENANDVAINTAIFRDILEGPVATPGRFAASVGIGSDASNAVTSLVKVATVTFTASAVTDSPVQLSFTTASEILSIAASDQAGENVLSIVESAYVLIEPLPVTPSPSPTPSSTPSPTPTQIPTLTPSVTPTIQPTATVIPTGIPKRFSYTVTLHGIGSGGDNSNPTGNQYSNKNPLHKTREVILSVFDKDDNLVATIAGSMNYDQQLGKFLGATQGVVPPASENLYRVAVYTRGYLRALANGTITFDTSNSAVVSEVTLVAGDVHIDNRLSILDYNQITDCYSDLAPARNCEDDSKKQRADITDDGRVDQFDYNLFLRELKVQPGI